MTQQTDSRGGGVGVGADESAETCPSCGKEGITITDHLSAFDYGYGDDAVELQAVVPVHHCGACEFEYIDCVGEQRKHDAVCELYGVLNPGDIRRFREDHALSRADFAHVSGLDEESLKRWENSLSIQTHAYDRYLRLLADRENLRRLVELTGFRNWVEGESAGS